MDTFTHSIYLKVADFLYKGFPPGSIAVYRDQSMPADLVERMLKNLTTGHFTGKVHTIGVQVDSISDSLSFAGESELWVSDCALIAVSPDRVAASIRNAKIHGAGTFFVIGPNSGNAASCLPERTEDHKSLILGPDWQGMVLPKHHLALHGSSRRIISGSTGLLCQSAHCFHQAASTSHRIVACLKFLLKERKNMEEA